MKSTPSRFDDRCGEESDQLIRTDGDLLAQTPTSSGPGTMEFPWITGCSSSRAVAVPSTAANNSKYVTSETAPGGDSSASANALESDEVREATPHPADALAIAALQQLRASPVRRPPNEEDNPPSDNAMPLPTLTSLAITRSSTPPGGQATPPPSDIESDEEVLLEDQAVWYQPLGVNFPAPNRFSSCHCMDDDAQTKALFGEVAWFYMLAVRAEDYPRDRYTDGDGYLPGMVPVEALFTCFWRHWFSYE